jgi:hypothetical protein
VLDAAFERLRSVPADERLPGHRPPGENDSGASTMSADHHEDPARVDNGVEELSSALSSGRTARGSTRSPTASRRSSNRAARRKASARSSSAMRRPA